MANNRTDGLLSSKNKSNKGRQPRQRARSNMNISDITKFDINFIDDDSHPCEDATDFEKRQFVAVGRARTILGADGASFNEQLFAIACEDQDCAVDIVNSYSELIECNLGTC